MAKNILPCRYCGAPTHMEDWGRDAVRIVNPDGTLHQCHEAERAKAIHTIFWGQIEDLCAPLSPEQVYGKIKATFDTCHEPVIDYDDLEAISAMAGVLNLVLQAKPE
jgi:hypothetical protein